MTEETMRKVEEVARQAATEAQEHATGVLNEEQLEVYASIMHQINAIPMMLAMVNMIVVWDEVLASLNKLAVARKSVEDLP